MRFLTISLIALLWMGCKSNDKKTPFPTTKTPSTQDLTTIEWLDSTFMRLDSTKEGKEVKAVFKFKNTGDKDLIIESATASCGCTVPQKPEEPIKPGKTSQIIAAFNSENRAGENIKVVYVIANTKPQKEHKLEFRIYVASKK